ncbi:MAG: hypothetical protein HXY18_20120 [Bryobacteraceae bacterium]|nr:hypothetical protein [Bryobacteraceae bacterium]
MLLAFLVSDTTLRLALLLLLASMPFTRLPHHPAMLATGRQTAAPVQLHVEAVELDVRLEPTTYTLAAKAMLGLRSRSLKPLPAIRLLLPAPFAARARIYAVWDHSGFLPWYRARLENDFLIVTTFTQPIRPLGQRWLVVRFDLNFTGFDVPDAPAQLTPHAASLHAAGWYPLPAGVEPSQFQLNKLRLGLRLPRAWRLRSYTESKHLHTGTEFAEYELRAKAVSANTLLFSAYAQ